MGSTRYVSVLGLGFGDCGKGHFVDALARRLEAHSVVRFNGGAQAGHNVVTSPGVDSTGRHHTFSQFCAGTFVPGVCTVLIDPMVVHPTALLVEAQALGRVGVHDALSRLKIDCQCRITTPYHQAAGRLRERLRGAAAHGTCGVGVGETVYHGMGHPIQALRYGELLCNTSTGAALLKQKLESIRETLLAELSPLCPSGSTGAESVEFQTLQDETIAEKWMTGSRALARQCPPESTEAISSQLNRPGCVLFEGAQGVLLDEWRGFHPYTTWSSITTAAVNKVASRFGIGSPIEHYGVLRSYLTRHGIGPFPTYDESLDRQLPEPHNYHDGWQGVFRRGHPDSVLLRYALEVAGGLSGLLIGHLDIFERGVSLKWCNRYATPTPTQFSPTVERLPLSSGEDLNHQSMLTSLLACVQPEYDVKPICSAQGLLDRIASVTSLPIVLRSFGATSNDVLE